ncbi:hypothetical protein [Streptomyces sp. NPDC018000]|uniref:hypothetical protein n=1 Tax=Streptomyces sp. NPDC018000 TaxID=3365028 RepID=UPI00378F1F88
MHNTGTDALIPRPRQRGRPLLPLGRWSHEAGQSVDQGAWFEGRVERSLEQVSVDGCGDGDGGCCGLGCAELGELFEQQKMHRSDAFPGLTAEAVLRNPPYGARDWGHEELAYAPAGRTDLSSTHVPWIIHRFSAASVRRWNVMAVRSWWQP